MSVDISRRRRSGVGFRLRFQLVAALACTVLPYLIRHWIPFVDQSPKIMLVSVVGSLVASLTGLFFVRNIEVYPGVEGSAYIIPSFCLAFGFVVTVFFFFRLEYSRSMFLVSFCLNIPLFYFIYGFLQRRIGITIGLVPGGDSDRLIEIAHIRWVPLTLPMDNQLRLSAIAADLRADVSDEWDRALADFALNGLPVYHSKHLHESLTGRVQNRESSEAGNWWA